MHRAYVGRIRKGKKREYISAHANVWPELIAAMRGAGVERECCFVFGDLIFVYVESDDIESTMKKLADDPVNQKWDRYMSGLLDKPDAGSSEMFPEIAEVFCMG